jgi:streptogramin lyase
MKSKLFFLILVIVSLTSCSPAGWNVYSNAKEVSALAVDPEGKVWAARKNYTIIEPVSGKTIDWPDMPGPLKSGYDEIKLMTFDHAGRLWIKSSNIPLAVRELSGEWIMPKPATDYDGTELKRISHIAVDGKGRIWIWQQLHLGMLDPKNGNRTYSFQTPGCDELRVFNVDSKGYVWAVCDQSLKMLDEKDQWVTKAELADDTGGGAIRNLVIDSNGQAWIGYRDNFQMLWPETTKKYEISVDGVHDFATDQNGRIFGEYSQWGKSGLFELSPDSDELVIYDSGNSGLASDYVSAVVVDREGKVWVAAYGGVSAFNPNVTASESGQISAALIKNILPSSLLGLLLIVLIAFSLSKSSQPIWVNLRGLGMGFAGWFIIFSIIWLIMLKLYYQISGGYIFGFILQQGIQILLPLAIIILFVFKKSRWLSLGIVAAIVVNAIFLILFYEFDFSALLNWTPFFLAHAR